MSRDQSSLQLDLGTGAGGLEKYEDVLGSIGRSISQQRGQRQVPPLGATRRYGSPSQVGTALHHKFRYGHALIAS